MSLGDTEFRVEGLCKQHNRKHFSCGIEELDRYFQKQASQDIRKQVATCFVLVDKQSELIAGYYTLSASSVLLCEFPFETQKKLPKYPIVPATLLGRLAIDKNFKNKKLGELLLLDAMRRCILTSSHVGTAFFIVEAKNAEATSFYKHYGLQEFPKNTQKLYMPVGTISNLLGIKQKRYLQINTPKESQMVHDAID